MQGLCSNDVVRLDLTIPTTTTTITTAKTTSSSSATSSSLSIDEEESTETRMQRLISEHPVIIFSRSSCCMCHAMKKFLATVGVNPTVIELDDHEISSFPAPATPPPSSSSSSSSSSAAAGRNLPPPVVFIGGSYVGSLDSLFALHLSGGLVPKLEEVGVL